MAIENINGLSLKDWLAAAGYEKADKELRQAWKDGEDPTDHKAESEWADFVDSTNHVHVCGGHLATTFTVFAFGAHWPTYIAVGHEPGLTSLEDCLEAAAECLKEVAPGCFTEPDYDAARGEILGETGCGDDMLPDEVVAEHAEADLTYTESGWIPSWEWTIVDIHATRAQVLDLANNR